MISSRDDSLHCAPLCPEAPQLKHDNDPADAAATEPGGGGRLKSAASGLGVMMYVPCGMYGWMSMIDGLELALAAPK